LIAQHLLYLADAVGDDRTFLVAWEVLARAAALILKRRADGKSVTAACRTCRQRSSPVRNRQATFDSSPFDYMPPFLQIRPAPTKRDRRLLPARGQESGGFEDQVVIVHASTH